MKNCKENTLELILKQPVTVSDLLSQVDCVYETVNQYLVEFEKQGKVSHKKSKFSIFYNPKLEVEKIDFFELMLNSTTRSIIVLLLKSTKLSQLEISIIIDKSHPSVSRTLKLLYQRDILEMNYNAPGKTYSLKNKSQIISWMKDTHPDLVNRMTGGLVEMFLQ
jgi:DNA-binding transcriptional ArsR family regulator